MPSSQGRMGRHTHQTNTLWHSSLCYWSLPRTLACSYIPLSASNWRNVGAYSIRRIIVSDAKARRYYLRIPSHGQHVYGPLDPANSKSVGIQDTKRKSSVAIDRHIFVRAQFRVSRSFISQSRSQVFLLTHFNQGNRHGRHQAQVKLPRDPL